MEAQLIKTLPHHATVCITGASGYLASWLVMRLLEQGYRVRGTVRNLSDDSKTAHLVSLPGAKERLELVRADLLDEESIYSAVHGCDAVFNVAVPLPDPDQDQGENIDPSVTAALNVLRACRKSKSVRRVVMTSTFMTVIGTATNVSSQVLDESSWTSVEYCTEKKMQLWGYMVAKTLAERAALEFAENNDIDLVTVLPSLVGGPFLTPSLPGSMLVFLGLMTELAGWMIPIVDYFSYVHIEDVAQAHILLMEDPRAKGRYLCSASDAGWKEASETVSKLLLSARLPAPTIPAMLVHTKEENLAKYELSTKKLESLGFTYKFDTLEKIFQDSMQTFIDKGYLPRENTSLTRTLDFIYPTTTKDAM